MILTISTFIAIAIVVNRYSKENEFAVYLSCGVSPFYWYRQVLCFAMPIALICGLCTMLITPWAITQSDQYSKFLVSKQVQKLISPSIFQEFNNGKQVFYVEQYSLDHGTAKNIFIQYQDNDDNTLYNATANSGVISYDQGNIQLSLDKGNRYQITNAHSNNYLLNFNFDTMQAKIDNTTTLEKANSTQSDSMDQLFQHKNQAQARKEISWRFSVALMVLVMALITYPLCVQISRVQGNLVFILPPVIYALYQNVIMTINASINDGKITSYWATLPVHILLIIASLLLTYYKTKPPGYFFSKNK